MAEGKKPFYKRWWFVVIVGVIIFNTLFNGEPEDVATNSETTEEQQQEIKVDAEKMKSDAISIDKQIYSIVLKSEENTSLIQEGAELVANGEGSLLDMYDLAKQVSSNQQSYFSALMDLKNDTNDTYIQSAISYILNGKSIAEDIMEYIDKSELKYMSSATESIENSSNYALNVISERMTFLADQGVSNDEISEILDTKE